MTIRHRLTRFLYRRYRAARIFFSGRPPDIASRGFFWLRRRTQALISARRLTKLDELERRLWKAIYFQRFGVEALYSVDTAQRVAIASMDHLWPRGTTHDNNRNRNFNLKLYYFLGYRADLQVMDLGCAGGGFVKSVLEDGYTAVGLEGSDWSRKIRSAE